MGSVRVIASLCAVCMAVLLHTSTAQEITPYVADVDQTVPLTILDPVEFDGTLILSTFGVVPYGTNLTGEIFYPQGDCFLHRDSDPSPCITGCAEFKTSTPPLVRPTSGTPQIFVLDETVDESQFCTRVKRALNAVLFGASAVIIVGSSRESVLTAAIDTELDTVLDYSRIRVPVAMIDKDDFKRFLELLDLVQGKTVNVTMGFESLTAFKEKTSVIEIWHDTAPDCGLPCRLTSAFFNDLSLFIELLPETTSLLFQPHFIFDTCDLSKHSQEDCDRNCVNNSRYCYHSDEENIPGNQVVKESIRQLCLWEALVDTHNTRNAHRPDFWEYKRRYQENCGFADVYGEECSKKTFNEVLNEQETTALFDAWQACYIAADLTSNQAIAVVEEEIARQSKETVAGANLEITNPAIIINGTPYRGHLDKTALLQAACQSLSTPGDQTVDECVIIVAPNKCDLGGLGDLDCRSKAEVDANRTKCLSAAGGENYSCVCDQGFETVAGSEICRDINECELHPDLCGIPSTRAVCVNTLGHYTCELNTPLLCGNETANPCWSGPDENGKEISSCVDNFPAYAAAAQLGQTLPPLAVCDCAAVPGCYTQIDEAGTCAQLCTADMCEIYSDGSGQCKIKSGKASILQVMALALFFVFLAATLVLLFVKRKEVMRRVKIYVDRYQPMDDGTRKADTFEYNMGSLHRGPSDINEHALPVAMRSVMEEPEVRQTPAREKLAARIQDFENFTMSLSISPVDSESESPTLGMPPGNSSATEPASTLKSTITK